MIEAQQAAFSFETFTVPKFSYNGDNQVDQLRMGFSPSGRYNSTTGEFELTLNFQTTDSNDLNKIIFELTAVSVFKFNPVFKFEELPHYFYKNAVAIMFPYVRAFISTLTLHAGVKHLNLGLMNLSELEKPLINNTTVV